MDEYQCLIVFLHCWEKFISVLMKSTGKSLWVLKGSFTMPLLFSPFPTFGLGNSPGKKGNPEEMLFSPPCIKLEGSFVFSNMCYKTKQADVNVSSAQLAFGVWNKPPDNQELLGRKGSARNGSVRLKIFCSSSDITERQDNVGSYTKVY